MTDLLATQSLRLSFPNNQNTLLAGRLDCPSSQEPKAFVIMGHCFTCTKETLTTARVSRGLAQRGFGILRFDFTGLGESEGSFADSNFTTMVDDILAAAEFLENNYASPVALLGHSMGGTAALAAAVNIPSCQSVVTIASPSTPSHVLHHFGQAMPRLEAGENAEINVAGIQYPVKPQFVQDVRSYDFDSILSPFDKRILALCAGNDSLVPCKEASEIIALTSSQSRLIELEDADHLFSNKQDTSVMIDEIGRWLEQDLV